MNVVITGKNGYIAKNTYKLFTEKNINTQLISVKGSIKDINFSNTDCLIHCAGLAHLKYTENEYYAVNRDLTAELAEKAKKDGVKQFIFISTISVYGKNSGVITESTPENPVNFYGKSKLEAEKILLNMQSNDFKTVIVRPPMVYGKNCTGNYAKLSKAAKIIPFFPDSENARSMIYIENLAMFLYNAAINGYDGIYHPRNKKNFNTFNMFQKIRECVGKNTIRLPKFFSAYKKGMAEKIFASLTIDEKLEKNNFDYCIYNLSESIKKSEL